jgi:hypothetical protein
LGDEDRLLSVVHEEAQCARRRIEVSLQHHSRSFLIVLVSSDIPASVIDKSIEAAAESERDERDGKRRWNMS